MKRRGFLKALIGGVGAAVAMATGRSEECDALPLDMEDCPHDGGAINCTSCSWSMERSTNLIRIVRTTSA